MLVSQLLPATHAAHVPPPQSTSVSLPFLTSSSHVGTWQTLFVHTPLLQSSAPAHARPSSQRGQSGPPQSMSVSLPFFAVSSQTGVMHLPPCRRRSRSRREPCRPCRPRTACRTRHHSRRRTPRRSSRCPCTWAAGTACPPRCRRTRPKRNRRDAAHPLRTSHLAQAVPPQSMSDSSAFRVPSLQEGSRHVPEARSQSFEGQSSFLLHFAEAGGGVPASPSWLRPTPSEVEQPAAKASAPRRKNANEIAPRCKVDILVHASGKLSRARADFANRDTLWTQRRHEQTAGARLAEEPSGVRDRAPPRHADTPALTERLDRGARSHGRGWCAQRCGRSPSSAPRRRVVCAAS